MGAAVLMLKHSNAKLPEESTNIATNMLQVK